MRAGLKFSAAVLLPLLAGCVSSQPPAQVVDNSQRVYARSAHFDGDREVAKYSNTQRAYQPPAIASKYVSEMHSYNVPAEIAEVEVATIEAPMSVSSSALEAPAAKIEVTQPFSSASDETIQGGAQPEVMQQAAVKPETEVKPSPAIEVVPALQPLEELASADLHSSSVVVDAPITNESMSPSTRETVHFIWPVEGRVISAFGPKKNGMVNDGINISAAPSEPIWAAEDGEVVYAGNELKGYGNMIIVRHSDNWMTAYAHASEIRVHKGQKVEQGDVIGYVGSTGSVKEAQLHFGIRQGKTPVDPVSKLPRRMASN